MINRLNNFLIATSGGSPRFENMLSDHIAAWRTTGFALIFSGISLGILALFFYETTVHRQLQHATSNVEMPQ